MKYTDYFPGEGCFPSDEGYKITIPPEIINKLSVNRDNPPLEKESYVFIDSDDGETYVSLEGVEYCPRKLKEENDFLREALNMVQKLIIDKSAAINFLESVFIDLEGMK